MIRKFIFLASVIVFFGNMIYGYDLPMDAGWTTEEKISMIVTIISGVAMVAALFLVDSVLDKYKHYRFK